MIRRVSMTNYGPFASAELELAPLTVVVGPNASGKSKLLEVVNHSSSPGRMPDFARFLPRMMRKGSDESAMIVFQSDEGQIRFFTKADDTMGIVEVESDKKSWSRSLRAIFLRLSPESLRSPSYIDAEQPLIREDGYGLATNLAFLKLNDIDTFNRLLEQTRDIVPTFENLRFRRARVPQILVPVVAGRPTDSTNSRESAT